LIHTHLQDVGTELQGQFPVKEKIEVCLQTLCGLGYRSSFTLDSGSNVPPTCLLINPKKNQDDEGKMPG
jgi:hypothetical protein